MTLRRSPSLALAAFVVLHLSLIAGCVILPSPVATDVDRLEEAYLAGDALVTAGPRRLLEGLSKRIEKAHPELTVVDPIVFRDTAFPDGGWRIDELLSAQGCRHVVEELDVRFLVLIGSGA